MSHIVKIKTRITDPTALAAACRRLGLAKPCEGTAKLFSEQKSGLLVQLPGWAYPIVISPSDGQVAFDNFNGNWGEQAELDKLLQAYAVEKTAIEAHRAGHTLFEQKLTDGSIKLTIQVGGRNGGAA